MASVRTRIFVLFATIKDTLIFGSWDPRALREICRLSTGENRTKVFEEVSSLETNRESVDVNV